MKCPKCGQICRTNREFCALCGTPLKQKRSHGGLIALIVILLLILAGLLVNYYLLDEPLFTLGRSAPAAEAEAPEPSPEPVTEAQPEPEPEARKDALFEDAAEIYALPTYTLALGRDGSVKLAGQSASPEFGFDLFDWSDIKQLLPTEYFIAGLTASGRVRLTGEVSGYEAAARWTDVAQLYYDGKTIIGLTTDGRVLAVGPELVTDTSGLSDIVNIIPGPGDSLAVAFDGRVNVVRSSGMLWDAGGIYGLADLAMGADFAMYLMEDGSVRTGASLYRILENSGLENPYYGWDNIRQLVIMGDYVAGLTRDGGVSCKTHIAGMTVPDTSGWSGVVRLIADESGGALFGLTEDGRVLASPEELAELVASWENVKDLQVSPYYVAALTGDGRVLVLPREGAPALETADWRSVAAISLGEKHLAALLEDGSVLAAGDNSCGQCGSP